MQVRAYSIPWGDRGTKAVIRRMVKFARSGSVHPIVRNQAVDILHNEGIEGRDSQSQVLAIRDWLDSNLEFMRDPSGAELVQSPARMLADLTDPGRPPILRVDCDDAAVLAAALGKAMGLRARFVGVGKEYVSQCPFLFCFVPFVGNAQGKNFFNQFEGRLCDLRNSCYSDSLSRWVVGSLSRKTTLPLGSLVTVP